MSNILIYVATVFIWGTTWIAIKFQIGDVDPIVSVIYRFALASLTLLVFCVIRRLNMKFSLRNHVFMALQGIFLFGVNYWLVYISEIYLTSGLVAVAFATLMFMNVFNGFIFLKSPIRAPLVIGSLIGVMGVGLIFWPEIVTLDFSDKNLFALVIAFLSVYCASLGNIIAGRNQRSAIPVVQSNTFGMIYGTLSMLVIALITGSDFNAPFAFDFEYITALVYLAVFGSVVAFGLYLTLLGRIGADKAAYALILVPVVALMISTFFEGYHWTIFSIIGLVMVLSGNVMIVVRKTGR